MKQQPPQRIVGHGDEVKARDRIQALYRVLGAFDSYLALLGSERPAKELLEDEIVADEITWRLSHAASGKGNDEACQWLFDTYQTQDAELQLVVLRFIPIVCGVYLSRLSTDEPLAGFEAVLLALYGAETTARGGRPVMINIPDLGHASLYHSPRKTVDRPQTRVGIVSPALEPQSSVKSSKRAVIVGVALELFCKQLVLMPPKAKLDLCHYARSWAVKGCTWSNEVGTIAKAALPPSPNSSESREGGTSPSLGVPSTIGHAVTVEQGPSHPSLLRRSTQPGKHPTWDVSEPSLSISLATRESDHEDGAAVAAATADGPRVALDLEVLRPVFKVLGHCLMAPSSTPALKVAAVEAANAWYARSSHSVLPEAMLASRSLIRLSAASAVGPSSPSTKVHGAERPGRQAS